MPVDEGILVIAIPEKENISANFSFEYWVEEDNYTNIDEFELEDGVGSGVNLTDKI